MIANSPWRIVSQIETVCFSALAYEYQELGQFSQSAVYWLKQAIYLENQGFDASFEREQHRINADKGFDIALATKRSKQ